MTSATNVSVNCFSFLCFAYLCSVSYVLNTYCVVFLFCFSSSSEPYVANCRLQGQASIDTFPVIFLVQGFFTLSW